MYVRDSLEDKAMLVVHFEKAFPLTLLGHSFESSQGIPYSCTSKVGRGWWTLC